MAKTFAKVSSNNNYSQEFLTKKTQSEANMPLFGTSNAYYNKPFDMRELDYALSRTKDTSPGEDGVTYKMLGNMPLQAKKHLLKMYNKFFQDQFFPESWSKSIVIPIPKPGKKPKFSFLLPPHCTNQLPLQTHGTPHQRASHGVPHHQ